MAETMATQAWLLSRVGKNKHVEVLGIFKTREIAEKNRDVLPGQRWQVYGPVPLLSWGFVAETGRLLSAPIISYPSLELH
jgi:hypothetical protein